MATGIIDGMDCVDVGFRLLSDYGGHMLQNSLNPLSRKLAMLFIALRNNKTKKASYLSPRAVYAAFTAAAPQFGDHQQHDAAVRPSMTMTQRL